MAKTRSDIDPSQFLVVGIGASAGGITALQSLFRSIPAHPNLSFVIVQHLMPDQPSQLARLMSKWAVLPVCEARSGMTLHRDCIYVAPPGETLGLERGVFVTRRLDDAGPRPGIDTIDSFFESLAADFGARSIAVVLSGTGADGAAGAVRVKQAGGMVFVQDPTTALHNGMPIAAIANGAADHVMPLGLLAHELIASASPSYVRSASAAAWADDMTMALGGMIDLIRSRAGFDLTGYKTAPLLWRIQRRMELRRVPLFRDYEALLLDDPAELDALIRGIPIHVTEFFRDASAWTLLQREVIPQLFHLAESLAGPVRAWTPACATGEEAYSLAMLLAEQADAMKRSVDFQVFATDASAEIVARAGRGIFKPTALGSLSAERRQRFFYAADGAYRVKRALREKMVFAPQDLLTDPPFTGLDLITCRNLLIYLEPDAGKRVIYLLHSALRMDGYLFLGKGESLSAQQRGFEELAPNSHIYRKTGPVPKADIEFPKRPVRLSTSRSSLSAVEAHSHAAAVENRDLPAVRVDDQFQIVRIYGDTGPFLRFQPGEPTLNLLQLVQPSVAVELKLAASLARSQLHAVTVDGVADPAMDDQTLSLRVTPLQTPGEDGSRLLVSFIGSVKADPRRQSGAETGESLDWSEALRISHEELEASREELQALNQELRASNDQLNLANEELNQANALLRDKIGELETQSNVLSSGAVMTLFLDEELCVRWFTPAISELFPLKAGDAGRCIADLAPKFNHPGFLEHVRQVMRTGEPTEAEVRTFDGRWYLKRIRPIRTGQAAGDGAGVAINFTDITDRKRAEERFAQFAASSAEALWIRDAATLAMEYVSPAIRSIYGIEPDALLGDVKGWAAQIVPEDRDVALDNLAKVREGEAVVHEFRIQRPADGAFRWIRSTEFPLLDEQGRVQRIGGIAQDVTEAKLAVEDGRVLLSELQHRVRSIMAMVRSIAARTGESAANVKEYAELMAGRLAALARVQTLLTQAANAGVNIATILHDELAAQAQPRAAAAGAARYSITGPDIILSPKATEAVTLALHELAMNALRYGALAPASPQGHIAVTWSVTEKGGIPWLRFKWDERGVNLAPSAPPRRGFGSELIEGRLPYELGGSGQLRIESGGVQCRIEFPLKEGSSALETRAPKRAAVFGGSLDTSREADLTGQRILVAEDDYFLATDTARALRGAGAAVLGPCPTEEAALDALAGGAPAAAVVDIKLGAGPVFKLAARLKRDGIPFLFITGYDELVIPPELASVPRLQKPLDLRQIVHLLAGVLAQEER